MDLKRRIVLAAALGVAAVRRSRTGEVHHRRVDDLDRAVGPLRHLLPIFEKKTGIKVRVVALGTGQALDMGAARRRRRRLRARPGGGEEVRRRGLRRQAHAGDVQRLRHRRPEVGSRQGRRRQGHARGAEEDRGREGAVRLARRQERHPCRRAPLLEGGRHRHRRAEGPLVQETGSGMGPTLNTASSMNAYVLTDRGTWLVVQEPRRPDDRGRGRQEALQPVRGHAGESRPSTRT